MDVSEQLWFVLFGQFCKACVDSDLHTIIVDIITSPIKI